MDVAADEVMPAVTPIGYAAEKKSRRETLMRKKMKSDERVPFDELFFAGDFDHPLAEANAGALAAPLQMVRWAPSATNKQPWRVVALRGPSRKATRVSKRPTAPHTSSPIRWTARRR